MDNQNTFMRSANCCHCNCNTNKCNNYKPSCDDNKDKKNILVRFARPVREVLWDREGHTVQGGLLDP